MFLLPPQQPSCSMRSAQFNAENKRFQPFHPIARFRGLSLSSSSSGGGIPERSVDLPDRDSQPFFSTLGHSPRHAPTVYSASHSVPSGPLRGFVGGKNFYILYLQ